MTAEEIRTAINEGKKVYWNSPIYKVIKDSKDQYLIVCTQNQYTVGLTHQDGTTLNGNEEEFILQTDFIKSQIKAELDKGKEPYEIFCINSAQGIYICETLQEYAIENGWEGFHKDNEVIKYKELTEDNADDYMDAYDEAEAYLNKHIAPEGYYFGSNEDTSDYNLNKIEEEEEPKAQPEVIKRIVKQRIEDNLIGIDDSTENIEIILSDLIEETADAIIEDNEELSYSDSEEVQEELREGLKDHQQTDGYYELSYYFSNEVAELRITNRLLKERIEELSLQVESLKKDLNFYEGEKDNRPAQHKE